VTEPVRLRLSRRAGFDLQTASLAANGLPCRVVSRPTRYGNPFVVRRSPTGLWEVRRGASLVDHDFEDRSAAARNAVKRFRRLLSEDGVRRKAAGELSGFNLACWCELGEPCHADVLLEFANADESGA
jgi:hypothetical protein